MELMDKTNNKEKNINLISIKSEDDLNIDFIHENETNKNEDKKKVDVDCPDLCDYSNKLFITSKNNKPINLERLDMKNVKLKEKEDLTNFKNNNEKDIISIININDLINIENNDYKNDVINTNQNKNFHIDNKIRKDSIISDYSNYGHINNNIFIDQNLFNNMNNFYFMNMNKLENEVFQHSVYYIKDNVKKNRGYINYLLFKYNNEKKLCI